MLRLDEMHRAEIQRGKVSFHCGFVYVRVKNMYYAQDATQGLKKSSNMNCPATLR